MTTADDSWMRRAFDLAERGRGHVEPNPLVGAVIVRGETAVGEGWHEKYGQAHAEVNALAAAGEAARGATLYVTLEPCCHHGKTPPCTEAIIRARIARVVVALEDPFPAVAGHGAAQLRAAGIAVEFGVDAAAARRQNAPYLKLLTAGRPYVHAKWAMSLDGKIATRTGDSRWISNEAARQRVHALRGQVDAIVVGIGTALADDPLLTARPAGPRIATRIILDSRARLPLDSQLVRTAGQVPTVVATTAAATSATMAAMRACGCEILSLPADESQRPLLAALLAELGRRRWTNVLVEGGSAVLGSFADARVIDELHVFIAPIVIGGEQAPGPMSGNGVARIADAWQLARWESTTVGANCYLRSWRTDP